MDQPVCYSLSVDLVADDDWSLVHEEGGQSSTKKKGMTMNRSSKAKGKKGFAQPSQYLCHRVLSSCQTFTLGF